MEEQNPEFLFIYVIEQNILFCLYILYEQNDNNVFGM